MTEKDHLDELLNNARERELLNAEKAALMKIMDKLRPEDVLTKMSMMGKYKRVCRDIEALTPPKP